MESKAKFKGYPASHEEFPGTINDFGNWMDPYERQVPEHFTGDSADANFIVDKFTQNVIKDHAIEGVN